jgi:L-fuconolactonase
LRLADDHDWISGVVGWVDLASPRVGEELSRFSEHQKLVGIRHIWTMEEDPAWILRRDVIRGLGELSRRQIPFDVLCDRDRWDLVPRLAMELPYLSMVIDHLGNPDIRNGEFDVWAMSMESIAALPNVMCKLSGMITQAAWKSWTPDDLKPYVHKALELFGTERVMFGSDWPVCLTAGSYDQVVSALERALPQLSDVEERNIWGANAGRFYGV